MNGRERERETEPAYQLVSKQLREHIAAGKYRGGLKLPTEFELAEQHGVSRQTVRRAFQDLVAEGIVYRVPGRGTFAAESDGRYLRQLGSIEDLMNLSTDTTMEVVSPLRRRVDIEAASRLRLDTDLVHTVVFRRRHDDTPFVLTTVYLPDEIARLVVDAPEMSEAPSARTRSSVCWSRTCAAPSSRRRNRSRSRPPPRTWPANSAAPRAIRCCGWTASIPIRKGGPSSWRSATSCPSTTPIA